MSKEVMVKKEERMMEYIPFGAKDKIKLTIGIVQNLICVPTKSGKRCSETDAIKFMMMCQSKSLNPFEGDAFLIGYDGRDGLPTYSLITAHQAFLKRAELNAEYDGMESGIIYYLSSDEDEVEREKQGDYYKEGRDIVVGGWAKVYFKNRSKPMYKSLRMSRFKKGFGIWQEDDAGMIVKCAEADALRSSFPTMLGGLYLGAEIGRDQPAMVTPVFSTKPEAPTVSVPPPAEEPVIEVQPTPMDQMLKLCTDSMVSTATLIQILIDKGIAPEGSTIDDLRDNEEVVEYVIAKWSDLTKKKGEANGKKGKDSSV